MLKVVAHIKALPGKENALIEVMRKLIEPTRKEQGCLVYEMFQSHTDPTAITFVEDWTDHAALEAHLASAHIQTAIAALQGLIDGAPDIRTYKRLG